MFDRYRRPSPYSSLCASGPHSDRLGIVARELALDIAQSSVAPDEAEHIPGLADKAPVALSSLYQPGKPPHSPDI